MQMWELLDKVNIIIGTIVAIPVFWSWYFLITQRRRQKQLIKSLETLSGDRPVAVSIDLMPGESENQALMYLKKHNLDMEFLKITREKLKKDELQNFVEELHKIKAEAMSKGADRIHLFYRGPVVGAMIVGEVFSNTSVTIYHFDKATGTYESWGPLHRSFI
ncbi:hypothetical protein JZK55_15060 [Dissulfurispira thermophila]|uniref:SMODS-associated and fused to various effectors domain-containing protein n=2 Tax=root TaxID=1 RepID=A0A7G1H1C8_9BACT|nr:SAVED domain-containing protein [Dissulfurispira thermophila]BCB96584.1 hypothetical protein JZK55_15060 [Dissulfurispira thermophila]